jgi:small nuclear ribonucleoprotein (snRNP)-like protein
MMFDACRQRASLGMRWHDRDEGSQDSVLGMLDDLELQAEGLHLAERAVEVDELSVAHYAEVELAARLHASIGLDVRVAMAGGIELRGRLAGVGADWILVDGGAAPACFAHLPEVVEIAGLGPRAVPDPARPVSARLSLRSVLRRLAEDGQPCALHLRGGRMVQGVLVRIGADFVDLRPGDTGVPVCVPLAAVAVVQTSGGGR